MIENCDEGQRSEVLLRTPLSVAGLLTKARAKIEKPEMWGKGFRRYRPGTCCAAEAIEDTCFDSELRILLFRALRAAVPGDRVLTTWNDAPECTHSEVLAAFDRAIVLADEEERTELSQPRELHRGSQSEPT